MADNVQISGAWDQRCVLCHTTPVRSDSVRIRRSVAVFQHVRRILVLQRTIIQVYRHHSIHSILYPSVQVNMYEFIPRGPTTTTLFNCKPSFTIWS